VSNFYIFNSLEKDELEKQKVNQDSNLPNLGVYFMTGCFLIRILLCQTPAKKLGGTVAFFSLPPPQGEFDALHLHHVHRHISVSNFPPLKKAKKATTHIRRHAKGSKQSMVSVLFSLASKQHSFSFFAP
jgi:hypothetical protein